MTRVAPPLKYMNSIQNIHVGGSHPPLMHKKSIESIQSKSASAITIKKYYCFGGHNNTQVKSAPPFLLSLFNTSSSSTAIVARPHPPLYVSVPLTVKPPCVRSVNNHTTEGYCEHFSTVYVLKYQAWAYSVGLLSASTGSAPFSTEVVLYDPILGICLIHRTITG